MISVHFQVKPFNMTVIQVYFPTNDEKCKIAKWLSEEVLQIAEKRREAKGKEENERQTFECRVPKHSKER